jgi:tRNA pseudouridine(55) synthase
MYYEHIKDKNIILANKPTGWTPLEVIQYLKKNETFKNSKLSYAGRLDPMARGIMIILKDDECKKQNLYHNFNKTYNFKLLLGISTDTYDILGKITECKHYTHISKSKLNKLLETFKGDFIQFYPPYSSVRVNGNPLWYYAKNNLLETVTIPSKKIIIHNLNFLDDYSTDKKTLLDIINNSIKLISKSNSDKFRQNEILPLWRTIKNQHYQIIELTADVSCGTYIRSLCHLLGEKLNIPAIALDIFRTKVDHYQLNYCN